MPGPQPYREHFDVPDPVREHIDRAVRGWVGWPTDPQAAPLWHAAVRETGNRNAPDVVTTRMSLQGTPILDIEVSEDSIDAIEEFREFVRGYTRSREGDTTMAYRYVEGQPEEAAGMKARTLESWTTDITMPRQFARQIRGEDEGTVVQHAVPVEWLYGTPETHPAIEQKEQSEVIVAQPEGATYADYKLDSLAEFPY